LGNNSVDSSLTYEPYKLFLFAIIIINVEMSELLNKKTDPIYTLGIASKLSSTPQHSIRQYIDKGLIIPFKTETKRHLFSDTDVNRLLWIKKQLNDKGLNFAGIKSLYSLIPCWKMKPCTVKARNECDAYNSTDFSCWEASNKGTTCKNEDCRSCEIYQLSGPDLNIKSILKGLLPK
jgi:MerR family transcriptional regulator/heat shock protein HspR